MTGNFISTCVLNETVLRRTGHPDVAYPLVGQTPSAPSLSVISVFGNTTATLNWTESANPNVVSHDVYINGVFQSQYVISGTALTVNLTGLQPATQYTIQVTRSTATLESAKSNSRVFTTTGTQPPVEVNTLMGVPDNGNPHSYTNWDAWRVYTYGSVDSVLSKGVQTIALTDSGTGIAGGTNAANQLRAHLMEFYGKTGAPSLHTNIETHWGNGNEVDRDSPNLTSFANTYLAMEDVINDFDMASLWFDGTAFNLRNGTTLALLEATAGGRSVADMLAEGSGGYASSYYAPGRQDYPNMTSSSYTGTGSGGSAPSWIVDQIIDTQVSYGIMRASIWEIGMPMLITPPPLFPNPGSTANNPTRRRQYLQDFLFYWFQYCIDSLVEPVLGLYWDQQSGNPKGTPSNNGNNGSCCAPDNRWLNDNTLITPNSATIWRTAPADFVPA